MTVELNATDRMVDAMLAAHRVPTLKDDFASRVLAAAASPAAERAATKWPRRSRRPWRRSPLWIGFIALNIVAASAVAAMVSGYPVWHHVTAIAQKVARSWQPDAARHLTVQHARVVSREPGRKEKAATNFVAVANAATPSVVPSPGPRKAVATVLALPTHHPRMAPSVPRHDRVHAVHPRSHPRVVPVPPVLPRAMQPHHLRRETAPHGIPRLAKPPVSGPEMPPVAAPRERPPEQVHPVRPDGPRFDSPGGTADHKVLVKQRREERAERHRLRMAGPRLERPHPHRPRGRSRF